VLKIAPAYAIRAAISKPIIPPKAALFSDELTLFITNLAFCTTDTQVKDFFEKEAGVPVKAVRIVTDRETGKSRGFAYAEFSDTQSMQKVLESANGKKLDGLKLKIEISRPPSEKGGQRGGRRSAAPRGRGSHGRGSHAPAHGSSEEEARGPAANNAENLENTPKNKVEMEEDTQEKTAPNDETSTEKKTQKYRSSAEINNAPFNKKSRCKS